MGSLNAEIAANAVNTKTNTDIIEIITLTIDVKSSLPSRILYLALLVHHKGSREFFSFSPDAISVPK